MWRNSIPAGLDRWLLKELSLTPDVPKAGIVAALRPEKNHELFLRAAQLIHEQLPRAEFLVVGDGAERAKLEKLAGDLGLGGAVHFLGAGATCPSCWL